MSKCTYCGYESNSLNEDDCEREIERHTALEHPLSAIWLPDVGTLMELHLKYHVPVDELFDKMLLIREKLSKVNRKNYEDMS